MRLLLAALGFGVAAAPLHQVVDGGRIDWTRGVLTATATSSMGAGPFSSRRTLEQEAWLVLEDLLDQRARAVPVTTQVVAGDLMSGEDPLALRLQEGLQTWRVTTTRYHRSGRIELEAELVLRDWLRPVLQGWAQATTASRATGGVTGVVVDARGLLVVPVVAPRLRSADGALAFGPDHLAPTAVVERSPAVWVTDPADPLATAQAGRRPLVIRAAGVSQSSDLIIDAVGLRALEEAASALAEGRLVLVVDP